MAAVAGLALWTFAGPLSNAHAGDGDDVGVAQSFVAASEDSGMSFIGGTSLIEERRAAKMGPRGASIFEFIQPLRLGEAPEDEPVGTPVEAPVVEAPVVEAPVVQVPGDNEEEERPVETPVQTPAGTPAEQPVGGGGGSVDTPAPPANETPSETPPSTGEPAAPASGDLSAAEQGLFDLQNEARAAAGLPPLTLDPTLTEVARARAEDMASQGYFSHTSPSGETAFTLLADAGYTYSVAGENIARGDFEAGDADTVVFEGFMDSEGHAANILNPDYTRVGIAYEFDDESMTYVAVVFAAP
jgi:uncharacterized protein YkwD